MKIRIIELLNKIANGEQPPKKIKYENQVYELTEHKIDWYCYDYGRNLLGNEIGLPNLNDKVEILETTIIFNQDKKIEKINRELYKQVSMITREEMILDKLDEIIDKLNEEEE